MKRKTKKQKIVIDKTETYDWLLTISGTETDGSIVLILPNRSVQEIKRYIQNEIKCEKRNADDYNYGTETLRDIVIRTFDDEIQSVYGYAVFSNSHIDYEAHILDKIAIEYKEDEVA